MHNAYNNLCIPMIIYCSLPKHHRTFPVTISHMFCTVHAQFLSGTVYLYVGNDIHLHCGQPVSFTTIISPTCVVYYCYQSSMLLLDLHTGIQSRKSNLVHVLNLFPATTIDYSYEENV